MWHLHYGTLRVLQRKDVNSKTELLLSEIWSAWTDQVNICDDLYSIFYITTTATEKKMGEENQSNPQNGPEIIA